MKARKQLAVVHEDMPLWVEAVLKRKDLSWRRMEAGDYWERELPFADLGEFQLYLILSDPVHFAECMFSEREEAGKPMWRLFDYQKVSARYRGNTIHECGSEVGKSREICLLHVWDAVTKAGDSLVTAAQDGHLELLYEDIRFQLEENPWLRAQWDEDKSKVKPYKVLAFENANRILFRPAGHDGTALRSVHVSRRISGDEVVKIKNAETFGNLFSRAKPGCETRLYSTPDGDRTCRFFELCQAAPECDPLMGPEGNPKGFVRFRWPKHLMPEPFWSAEREQKFIEEYGGRETSEYQNNVFGAWGDPSSAVFPWPLLSRCLGYVPEYTFARLYQDTAAGRIHLSAYTLNRGYHLVSRLGDEGEGEELAPPAQHVREETFELSGWEPKAAMRSLFLPFDGNLVAGADLGATNDPTEIVFATLHGENHRFVGRLQLVGFGYLEQDHVFRALDQHLKPSMGWGLDASGVGSAVQHHLEDFERGALDLTGFVMNAKTEDIDPTTGEVLEDDGKPRRVSYLELGTRLLELAIQQQRSRMPYDPEWMLEFQGLTSRKTSTGARVFVGRDHIVTACRVALLRALEMQWGGAPSEIEFLLPSNSYRDSSRIREEF